MIGKCRDNDWYASRVERETDTTFANQTHSDTKRRKKVKGSEMEEREEKAQEWRGEAFSGRW